MTKEHPEKNNTGVRESSRRVRQLAVMGLLTALSVVLVYFVHFPIFPAAPFLEYDPADIPIFIGTFAYGPAAGFLLTLVASVIQGVTVSAKSGPIGILMHVFATGSFTLVSGSIYQRKKSKRSAIIALAAGVVVWVITMVIWNLIFTPIFMGTPREAVLQILVPVIVPFNLLKAGVNSLITFVVYKKVSPILHKV